MIGIIVVVVLAVLFLVFFADEILKLSFSGVLIAGTIIGVIFFLLKFIL